MNLTKNIDAQDVFEFLKKIRILPRELQEAELFVYGFTFLLLLGFIDSGLLGDLLNTIAWEWEGEGRKKGGITYGIVMLLVGAVVAIYIALNHRPHGKFVTYCIRLFFPTVNAALAIAIGIYTLNNPTAINYILAGWQFMQAAAFLLFTGRDEIGDFYNMPERQARRNEIILACAIVVVIGVIGFVYSRYWAVIFSSILFVWRNVVGFLTESLGRKDLLMDSPIMGKRKG